MPFGKYYVQEKMINCPLGCLYSEEFMMQCLFSRNVRQHDFKNTLIAVQEDEA